MRAIERNFRVPIAGHVDLDFGAVPPRRICSFSCTAGMHLHSGHVHVEIELYVPHIDELILGVSEFDDEFVVAAAKLALRINEVHR